MEQIYKYLICAFFGLITFILDDPSHDYPVLSAFLIIARCFFIVYPLLSVLNLMLMHL